MADLTPAQRAGTIKIVGADPSTGVANNFAEVTPDGKLTTLTDITPPTAVQQTAVALTATSWTPLPTTPLTGRKSIAIQNQSTTGASYNVLVNFTGTGVYGWRIQSGGAKSLVLDDSVVVYAKMETTLMTGIVIVEELA